jgi:hypothetical protein
LKFLSHKASSLKLITFTYIVWFLPKDSWNNLFKVQFKLLLLLLPVAFVFFYKKLRYSFFLFFKKESIKSSPSTSRQHHQVVAGNIGLTFKAHSTARLNSSINKEQVLKSDPDPIITYYIFSTTIVTNERKCVDMNATS